MSTQALLSRALGSPLAAAALLVLGLCFESRVPLFFGGGGGRGSGASLVGSAVRRALLLLTSPSRKGGGGAPSGACLISPNSLRSPLVCLGSD